MKALKDGEKKVGWKTDKKWSDRFLPEIKSILGQHLIGEPPVEEDQERNTDLIVLRMEAVRIACRVRRSDYYPKFKDEFTIRACRPSGCLTELAKIISGYGDYFFYAICDPAEKTFLTWHLCDLRLFRLWFNAKIVNNGGCMPGHHMKNNDGSSEFRVFKFSDLPSTFVIANMN